jgi:hypothetical protein
MIRGMIVGAALLVPGVAVAECAAEAAGAGCGSAFAAADGGARRVAAAEAEAAPAYRPGDILPRERYQVLIGSEYYGLPPVDGGWRYFRVEDRVLRVRPDTLEVIEDATAEANRAF